MRATALKPPAHLLEDVANVFHMDHWTVLRENLDEAAHVSALEVMRQVNRKLNIGDCALNRMLLVADLQRVAQRLHSYTIDRHAPLVALVLCILQHLGGIFTSATVSPSQKKPCGRTRLCF